MVGSISRKSSSAVGRFASAQAINVVIMGDLQRERLPARDAPNQGASRKWVVIWLSEGTVEESRLVNRGAFIFTPHAAREACMIAKLARYTGRRYSGLPTFDTPCLPFCTGRGPAGSQQAHFFAFNSKLIVSPPLGPF